MNDDLTQKLERRLVALDEESDIGDYPPQDDAVYIATDTGVVYEGDGSDRVKPVLDDHPEDGRSW